MKTRKLILCSVFLIALSCLVGSVAYQLISARASSSAVTVQDRYVLMTQPCWFENSWQEDIECGELITPVSAGEFSLPVVIIRDNSPDHRPDPVVYLQGGPGASADLTDSGIKEWLAWRDYMALGRDLILFDPRGVGRSKPALSCKRYDEFSVSVLKRNTVISEELEEGFSILQECFADFSKQENFHLKHYTTELHAQDLNEMMHLLGFDKWNLLGVSYGTRVAIESANRLIETDKVRSVILDSVYPAGHGGVQSFPEVFDRAFKQFFSWCSTNTECASHETGMSDNAGEFLKTDGSSKTEVSDEKNISVHLFTALDKLKRQPITLTLSRMDGEPPLDVVVNDHRFIAALFSALYSKHSWQKISPSIHAAIEGDAKALTPLMQGFINNSFAPGFNNLAFMLIDCADNPVTPENDYQRELEKFPLFADYTQDLWRYQSCHFLTGDKLAKPDKRDIPNAPAFILAGDLDPITPLDWAQELHEEWYGSQLLIFSETGHAVINNDECAYQILRGFLDDPEQTVKMCTKK